MKVTSRGLRPVVRQIAGLLALAAIGCSDRPARSAPPSPPSPAAPSQTAAPTPARDWTLRFSNRPSSDPDLGDDLAMATDVTMTDRGAIGIVGTYMGGMLRLGDEDIADPHQWLDLESSFLVVLGPDGSRRFTWRSLTAASPSIHAVGADLVAAFSATGAARLGDVELRPVGQSDAIVARLREDGSVIWRRALEATDRGRVQAIAHQRDQLWVGGVLRGTSPAHPRLTEATDDHVAFLLRLDPATGAPTMAARLTSPTEVGITAIVPRADGGVFALGDFHDALRVGAHAIEGEALKRGWVAAFDATGEVEWVHRLGETAAFVPGGMVPTSSGRLLVFGDTRAPLSVGGAAVAIERGPLAIGIEPTGTLAWARSLSGLEGAQLRDTIPTDDGAELLAFRSGEPPLLTRVSADGTVGSTRTLETASLMIGAGMARQGETLVVVSNTETAGLAGEVRSMTDAPDGP